MAFDANGRKALVAWEYDSRIGKLAELLQARAHLVRVAALEIDAARCATEQRIAREHHARLAVKAGKVEADAALRVARGKHDLELE